MTQITVTEVKDGANKYGNLKATNGAVYMFPVGMNGVFQPGQTYDVPVKTENWKDKRSGELEKKYIITGRPGSAGSGAVAQPAVEPAPMDIHGNPHLAAAREIGNPPTPRPAPPAGNSRDVQIASIALMKSFIETGKFGLTDLPMLEGACIPAAKRIVAGS